MADSPKRVLSLGAGVQSSTLLLMSCCGELPKLDAAIFADTQYEPKPVYEHLEWLEGIAAKAGIPVYRVTRGDLRTDAIEFRPNRASADGKRYASIPMFVLNPDGTVGRVRRQCTKEYKIEPIETFIRRELLGLEPGQRAPRECVIEQWMGITADESHRAKPPGEHARQMVFVGTDLFGFEIYEPELTWKPCLWKCHTYPFLDMTLWPDRSTTEAGYLAHKWTRQLCAAWLKANYPDRDVPRSACIGCPYRSNAEWRKMRDTDPESWRDAVEFDKALRVSNAEGQRAGQILVGLPFVHRTCVPLDEANLDDDAAGSLFAEECEGMCGV